MSVGESPSKVASAGSSSTVRALLPRVAFTAVALPTDEAHRVTLRAATPDNLLHREFTFKIRHHACQQGRGTREIGPSDWAELRE
eukprot:7298570-Prymnesium_polylepis.1